MKYIDEYRDPQLAKKLAADIAEEAGTGRSYHLMEFCGGHTHAISRYGLEDLLPENVRLIHGPGCPVCVLPVERLDMAINLACQDGIILCSYGDMMRVPGTRQRSLLSARAEGADIRMVYSAADALAIAQQQPERQVVFFAIGFETTTPPTAVVTKQAAELGLKNFSVLCNHVLTPAAIQHMFTIGDDPQQDGVRLDGFIGPAHVSTVIGTLAYQRFCSRYHRPVVIAGFEPLDVMQSIRMLLQQINRNCHEVENEYIRAVTPEGNLKAQALVAEVFEIRERFDWRGLGSIPDSALRLKPAYRQFDAELRFSIPIGRSKDVEGCECGAILRGVKKPVECRLFGVVCTPENPMGSCMVSAEGACAAYWSYGRFRQQGQKSA